jgi:hypothetical protein
MIGDCWLSGKAVHVYETKEDPDLVMLIGETSGGKTLIRDGQPCIAIMDRERFVEIDDNPYEGVEATIRALEIVGFIDEDFS